MIRRCCDGSRPHWAEVHADFAESVHQTTTKRRVRRHSHERHGAAVTNMTTRKKMLEQREAYQLGVKAHHEQGCYVRSPYTPWSTDDMAWECAMDDATDAQRAETRAK